MMKCKTILKRKDAYQEPNSAFAKLITFNSSQPSIVRIDPENGTAEILEGFFDTVILQATSPEGLWSRVAVHVNVAPPLGQMALGYSSGMPTLAVTPDATFEIPLRIAAGNQNVGGFSAMVYYEASVVEPVGYAISDFCVGGQFFVNFKYSSSGQQCVMKIVGLFSDLSAPPTGLFHAMTITFQSLLPFDQTTLITNEFGSNSSIAFLKARESRFI